ncbi:MAG: cell division protein FtsX, partial [Mangrovibacterium sp.]|nr:cell division protein FtsX [Mangrovibacterium sp.]
YSRRFIINTMKLVGATRSFIRRPFVMKSISHGLLAGFIANAGIFLVVHSYRDEFRSLVGGEQTGTIVITLAVVFAFGALISWLSTHLAVNKFLRLRFEDLFD